MSAPVDRSITVSAPHRVAHVSFSTSSAIDDVTAELPMLALIFTRKLRPMAIGSDSGWLTLAGMMARPRATSSRTNSAVDALAQGDELHLRRDLAAPGVVHLGDGAARLGPQRSRPASPVNCSPLAPRRAAARPSSRQVGPAARRTPRRRPARGSSGRRSGGRPTVGSDPGPLVSYSRTGSLPSVSATSVNGTRRRPGPSTYTLLATRPSSHSLRRHYPDQVQTVGAGLQAPSQPGPSELPCPELATPLPITFWR